MTTVTKGRDHTGSKGTNEEITQYRMGQPDTYEVSLCGRPAVQIATFLAMKDSRPRRKLGKQPEAHVTMGFPIADVVRRQVFGYATAPFIYDSDGDMLNPHDVEVAQNTFMKNIHANTAPEQASLMWTGVGVGENHRKWTDNGFVVASAIDYTGDLGGIPGGWWFGVQVTNPDTWEKCLDGTYNGFSIGASVNWQILGTENHITEIGKALPNLSSVASHAIKTGRTDGMKALGAYTYPASADDYADPVNFRLPIDTVNRSLCVFDYLTGPVIKSMDGYTKEEFKMVLQNVVKRLQSFDVGIPDQVYAKLGLSKPAASKSYIGLSKEQLEVLEETPTVKTDETPQEPTTEDTPAQEENKSIPAEEEQKLFGTFKKWIASLTGSQNPVVTPKEEINEMNPEEIKKFIQDTLAASAAETTKAIGVAVAEAIKAEKEAATKAAEEQAAVAKAQTDTVATTAAEVVKLLEEKGLFKKEEQEPSDAEQLAEATKALNAAAAKVAELTGKVSSMAPGQMTSPRMAVPGAPANTTYSLADKDYPSVVLTDDSTGHSFQTTKADYEFAVKWAEENKFTMDSIEENLAAAASEGILPSQQR